MAFLELSADLLVDNKFIDSDHAKLVQLVNDFNSALATGKANGEIGRVLDVLVDYTREHFAREESEMARIKYAQAITHKHEHSKLLHDVRRLSEDFENGRKMMSLEVSKFLKDWLVNHIMKTDKLFAKALNEHR
jgi:hemerythrin-like metal-binding protein